MSDTQQRNVRLIAVALTFLLGGAAGGAYWVHNWWQGRVKDPAFLASASPSGIPDGAAPASAGPPAALVRVDQASLEEVVLEKPIVGRLNEIRRTTVSSEVAGKVTAMNVREGDNVQAGKTVIATVDPVWLELSIDKQKARIDAIKAKLLEEKDNLKRVNDLFQRGVATEHEQAKQLAAHDQKQAELSEAGVVLKELQVQRARVEIVAPFDGWVTRRHAELGQWLNPGSMVVDLVSRGEIYALMSVPEALINSLSIGMEIPVAVDVLERTYTGKIASITPDGSAASRTYPVRVALSDDSGRLKVGMSVTATFPAGARQKRVLVSRDAVLIKPDGSVVWVVPPGPAKQALPVPVDVVGRVGKRYAILPQTDEGKALLTQSAVVVIEGAERLRPRQNVRYLDEPAGPAKPALAGAPADAARPAVVPTAAGADKPPAAPATRPTL